MIEIIPAIDLIGGRCVRLEQGDFAKKTVYGDDPVAVAKAFESAGVRRLHLVDLDGARSGKPVNLEVLRRIATETDLCVDFGGGIKTDSDLEAVFDAGARIATVGSIAVTVPDRFERWLGKYGASRFLLGADVRGRRVVIDGWRTVTDHAITDFLTIWQGRGIESAFVTDVERDGMLDGPATELYRTIAASVPELELIASGGVASSADLVALESAGCSAAIIGKALYESRLELSEVIGR